MSFTNQAEFEHAVQFVTNQARTLDAARQGGLGLTDEGMTELLRRGTAHIGVTKEMNLSILVAILDQLKKDQPFMRDDVPSPDDQQLKDITSIEAARGLSVERLRNLNNNIAFRTGLHRRFNERCAWLQANDVHEVKVEAEPTAPVVLTPEQQKRKEITDRLNAVYAKIDKAGGEDWQVATINFRKWLRNKVAELISEKRGIGFIEKHIDDKIHDQETGSIR